jgi:pyrrolysine biosynthesis protein PylC
MLAAVIGGNLQGIEATYLGQKAGWEVMVIDKSSGVPASGFCDSFFQLDVTSEMDLMRVAREVDIVIPALENEDALARLGRWADIEGVPYAFDSKAYSISSSKLKSRQLFLRLGIPTPESWPQCGFPVVAKPSRGSGSEGVQIVHDMDELKCHIPGIAPSDDLVIQEFLPGPSYSLEVLGSSGQYEALQVTDLAMDRSYDCKRVLAPTELTPGLTAQFEEMSLAIAEALELRGVMDVEMIVHDGLPKILEVDARLPSQTPTAVYWSTGLNIVEMLGELFLRGSLDCVLAQISKTERNMKPRQGVIYEHIRVSRNGLEVGGEHIMTSAGPLKIWRDFFGVDEAITSYEPGRNEWVATLIISGTDRQDAWNRRCQVIEEIRRRFGLEAYFDQSAADHLAELMP